MLSIVTHCADNKNYVPAVFQDEKSAYFYMKYRAAIDIRDSHKVDNPKFDPNVVLYTEEDVLKYANDILEYAKKNFDNVSIDNNIIVLSNINEVWQIFSYA